MMNFCFIFIVKTPGQVAVPGGAGPAILLSMAPLTEIYLKVSATSVLIHN